ncbi:MAG TPA: hypothetical protein VGV38_00530 [Pyrinomonadaceae bacterium]|nr:hypothetical protein [Pyrinomonadaceae bacterium]
MPIIINEFEIVVEPPEKPTRGGGEDEQPAAAPEPLLLRPYEIADALRVRFERLERVRAD